MSKAVLELVLYSGTVVSSCKVEQLTYLEPAQSPVPADTYTLHSHTNDLLSLNILNLKNMVEKYIHVHFIATVRQQTSTV